MAPEEHDNIIVILAGGLGLRFDAGKPKQYLQIRGRELLSYSVEAMRASRLADRILIVLNHDEEEIRRVEKNYQLPVIAGGEDRAHSFQNALDHIRDVWGGCRKVIFHEAARPLVTAETIDLYFELLDRWDYVETCRKITDSLGSYTLRAPRREDYYLIQAPEAYRYEILQQYYDCESDIYFAANQFPDSVKGTQYFGLKHNYKLTTPEDLALIELLLGDRDNK